MSKKKLKSLDVLQQMKTFMKPDHLYRAEYIARMLGLNLPNMRRYLRRLAKYGLIEVYKHPARFGKYKFYKLVPAKSRSPVGDTSIKEVKEHESKSGNVEKAGRMESKIRDFERDLESAIAAIDE